MKFKRLYEIVLEADNTDPKFVCDTLVLHHMLVGQILIHEIPFDPPNRQAHLIIGPSDRSSPYEEAYNNIYVRYCRSLAEAPAELKFALIKELMHIFDLPNELVDRMAFGKLLNEIGNPPLVEEMSPSFKSELTAKWLAIILLCPKSIRDDLLAPYRAGQVSRDEVAKALGLPIWTVPHVMDNMFERVFEKLVQHR